MNISFPAPKLVPFLPKVSLKLGSKFRILCQAEQESIYHFSRSKNGHLLSSNAKYRIESSPDQSQLTIVSIELEDSANFSCSARNEQGLEDTQFTQLEVKG